MAQRFFCCTSFVWKSVEKEGCFFAAVPSDADEAALVALQFHALGLGKHAVDCRIEVAVFFDDMLMFVGFFKIMGDVAFARAQ